MKNKCSSRRDKNFIYLNDHRCTLDWCVCRYTRVAFECICLLQLWHMNIVGNVLRTDAGINAIIIFY